MAAVATSVWSQCLTPAIANVTRRGAVYWWRRRLRFVGALNDPITIATTVSLVRCPLDPGHDWDAHKAFSKHFGDALSMAELDRFVATMYKAMRKGRIFIDWLRNQRGSTSVMPYSARARPGGPVAVPVGWEALAAIKSTDAWTIDDAGALIEHAASPEIRGWGFAAQTLPDY